MGEKILITGGAGFIGSHLADALIKQGHQVTILDVLHPQVHGSSQQLPEYLHSDVHFVHGDVRNRSTLETALEGIDVVFHFAAYTGVGQSMYQVEPYLDVNVGGTAVLLQLLSQGRYRVRKVILASSRAVYGEGAYECSSCGIVTPSPRGLAQLRSGRWEVICPNCGQDVRPIPTTENKVTEPGSIYAVSKLTQEQSCLIVGQAHDLPVVVLRFFNVYGPRQSMQNPYTGVINAFITRLVNQKPPQVYEDGRESRDFVHVSDVVLASLLAMQKDEANGQVVNIGSGEQLTLLQIAQMIAKELNGPPPVLTGQFRAGDIRHCYADLRRAHAILGYVPQVTFTRGIKELLQHLADQRWPDLTMVAEAELIRRGLAMEANVS